MARVVGDISVRVGADIGPLQQGMRRAGQSVDDFQSRTRRMAANVAKAGAAIVAATAAASAGILKMAQEAADAGAEIKILSDIAGVGTTQFQKMAAASRTVGVEQDKLSDIMKDVSDKFGDFMATGAGPLADFFENIAPKIGVTAQEFANLSGPDALQLYVSSLEKAGVSQQQMTFYMEALASDATALLPILRDNGREMRRLGDEAEAAGRIMSEDTIAKTVELKNELDAMTDTLRTQAIEAIVEYQDEILAAARFLVEDLIPAMASIAGAAVDFVSGLAPAIEALEKFINLGRIAAGGASVNETGATLSDQVRQDDADRERELGLRDGDTSGTGLFGVDENGNLIEFGANGPTEDIPGITSAREPLVPAVRPADSSRRSGRGGGGRRGPSQEDFERLQEQYASEQEQLEMHLAAQLEKLQEYRDAKLATEDEFNSLETDIRRKHLDDMAQLEQQAQRARLQSISGAFGDLSSLMASENKKVFKIGQAAALAEATISGYQAAVDAWQKGMKIGGPPVAAAFTAASLAKTGALIGQIKSASPSGSGGGGSIGGGGSAQPQIPQQGPLEARITGLGPNDIFRGADFGAVLERLQEEAGDRGLSITVAR